MQEEILEGNKLIAEFMGLKIHKNGMCDNPTNKTLSLGLQYHSSWDWLMPVWKKLGNLIYEIRRHVSSEDYKRVEIITINVLKAFLKVEINSVFNWIVEGIKWYNQL